jgi:glycosyltransferase involved in cell wall biosynthesis
VRILHVTDFFPPVRGGLEGHVDDLAAAQVAFGHDVHVATLTPAPAPRDERVITHPVTALATRLVRHADADRPFHPPLPDPIARRRLRRVIDEVRPDVVHAHSWLGVSLPRHGHVPVVLTAHDYALVCQLHTLVRTDGTSCDGPGVGSCFSCAGRTNGWVRSALLGPGTAAGRRRWSLDAVLTLSEQVAGVVRGFTSAPVHTYGGLLPRVHPAAVPELPDSFVLFAGDPGRHKGLDVLLDAWPTVGAGVRLVVASTKPVDLVLPEDVVVLRLDRDQMATASARAAVVVVPSVWPEPYGMVAMEALAAGTPVVASRAGALPEIVRDGVDGVLVPPGDRTALAAALRALLDDESTRRRMAAAALGGAERFSPAVVVARVDEIYEQVLARSPVAR